MTNKGVSKAACRVLDRLSDFFPTIFTAIFQRVFLLCSGNTFIFHFYWWRYRRMVHRIKSFENILIIIDVGIGDAIIVQQSAIALREQFPGARIDYLCNRFSGELLTGMSFANRIIKVFSGNGVPSMNELQEVKNIATRGRYDCILNLSPFVDRRIFKNLNGVIHLYVPVAASVLHEWYMTGMPPHISSGIYTFIRHFFSTGFNNFNDTPRSFRGNIIYVPEDAIKTARTFLILHNCFDESRLVYMQLHSSSKFTQPPVKLQRRILENILRSNEVDAVLVDTGGLDAEEELEILGSIELSLRAKLIEVYRPPFPVFAALVDACTVFVSGDGGPLHIAAARRIASSGNIEMKNSTTIVTIFGATDSRMYGYDSELPGYLPANQNAPSKVFVANVPCRNATCINKLGKTCREVRCFDGLFPDKISDYIISHASIHEKSHAVAN